MKGRLNRFWSDFRVVLGDRLPRLPLVVLLMLLAAGLDLLGIGLIAPFIQAAFGDASPAPLDLPRSQYAVLAAAAVLAVFVLRGLAQFQLQRTMVRFSDHLRGRIMSRLLGKYLRQPWEFHLGRSHAELTNSLLYEVALFSGNVLNALLRLFADGIVLLAIGIFLLILNPAIATSLGLVLGAAMLLINLLSRKPMRRNAERIVRRYERVVNLVGNSLDSLKQARVLGSDAFFTRQLSRATREQAEATALQNALQTLPRSSLELAIVGFMIGFGLYIGSSPGSAADAMALLGTFAVAGLRLIPAATSVTNQVNLLRANRLVLGRLAQDLSLPEAEALPQDPERSPPHPLPGIELLNAGYRYPGSENPVLDAIHLRLEPGACVGLIGASGSGKSTLADLLLGLLVPTQGRLLVDGRDIRGDELNWTRRCAYIPQSSGLFNDTLRANMTMSEQTGPDIDRRVRRALEEAAIGSLPEQLTDGLETLLGDQGQRLSGGQRQRVAIARAFFHRREFLILDEATSALDSETEQEVVAAVERLKGRATMLIIAHRHSTLAPCERVYELRDGRLEAVRDGVLS